MSEPKNSTTEAGRYFLWESTTLDSVQRGIEQAERGEGTELTDEDLSDA